MRKLRALTKQRCGSLLLPVRVCVVVEVQPLLDYLLEDIPASSELPKNTPSVDRTKEDHQDTADFCFNCSLLVCCLLIARPLSSLWSLMPEFKIVFNRLIVHIKFISKPFSEQKFANQATYCLTSSVVLMIKPNCRSPHS